MLGAILVLALLASGAAARWYFQPAAKAPAALRTGLRINYDYAVSQPIPQTIVLDAARVALGGKLFHDARLSADDTGSCASCHNLAGGGVDNRSRSIGVRGGVGGINAPTVFNSGLNFVQFWDGRAPTLEAQIDGPVTHPLEMASNWQQVIGKLGQDPVYVQEFSKIYPDGLSAPNIKNAIAEFERSLLTPNSRFDKFLRGDSNALAEQEKSGYALFQSYGCSSCHQGVNLGGNMYEKMGLMGDYFADRGNPTEADKGRFNLTHNPDNLYEFRVPSLRNVALSAPYFHDGSAKTLEDAIAVMVKYQLGRPMPDADLQSIAAFLRTLTGQYQGKPL
jgi:cytochrome c peroxidase